MFIANRSVYACQKAAKRKFSSNNYKGKWTEEEEIVLVEMVKEHGQTWSIISKELERTPENCRDKFREIGSVNPEKRKKGKWELEELLELIRIVNKYNDNEFVKRSVI
jgi:transposase-like protein